MQKGRRRRRLKHLCKVTYMTLAGEPNKQQQLSSICVVRSHPRESLRSQGEVIIPYLAGNGETSEGHHLYPFLSRGSGRALLPIQELGTHPGALPPHLSSLTKFCRIDPPPSVLPLL